MLRCQCRACGNGVDILDEYFKESGPTHELSDLTLRPKHGGTRSMFGSSNYASYSYGGYSFGGNSIGYRNRGACLSHNHSTQYRFVLQSLTLWKEIMQRLPMLWLAADEDMIHQAYRHVTQAKATIVSSLAQL